MTAKPRLDAGGDTRTKSPSQSKNRKGGDKAEKTDFVRGPKIGDELEIAKFDKEGDESETVDSVKSRSEYGSLNTIEMFN